MSSDVNPFLPFDPLPAEPVDGYQVGWFVATLRRGVHNVWATYWLRDDVWHVSDRAYGTVHGWNEMAKIYYDPTVHSSTQDGANTLMLVTLKQERDRLAKEQARVTIDLSIVDTRISLLE